MSRENLYLEYSQPEAKNFHPHLVNSSQNFTKRLGTRGSRGAGEAGEAGEAKKNYY
ncbi:hypothetical protein [Anabaena sp. CCY 9910]|uniref:hypothetical protein n=1 Tax=Anabaena sp. CCY 9910 TaxID=3103870 RepID=UPI0039E10766